MHAAIITYTNGERDIITFHSVTHGANGLVIFNDVVFEGIDGREQTGTVMIPVRAIINISIMRKESE